MEYRNLGKSGLKVSALSFGAWLTFGKQIPEETAKVLMQTAYENGVNFFDNAEQYEWGEAEKVMGRLLKSFNWERDTYIVSSKVFWGGSSTDGRPGPNQKGLSRKHVFEACHQALERLQVDYLDLFFCHRPDVTTPIEETVWAMNDLMRQGKILYWGTSEWSAVEIMEAYAVARQYNLVPPTMEQPQYNMFHRERFEKEYDRLYSQIGLGTTVWSPLASGLLTGKYNQGTPEKSRATEHMDLKFLDDRLRGETAKKRIAKVAELIPIANDLGLTPAQFALAWVLKNPNVSTAIMGASKKEQILDNIKAVESQDLLTDDVMQKVEEILQNKPELPPVFVNQF